MDTKKDIRTRIIKKRNELDPITWKKYTDEITDTIISMDVFREATDIYCFIDFNGEVGTRGLITEAWKLGKTVWVPKVYGDNMVFFEITSFDQLRPGTFGVMEPSEDEYECADGEEGLVIVPGVAFDRNRNRVGYGKGYYDKYLSAHQKLNTIAVAFELQLVDEIPADTLDIRPNMLVTEMNIYQS